MPSLSKPSHNGKIKEDDLAGLIADLGFVADKGEVNALTYELGDSSLKRYYRLLSPIRDTEVVQYETARKKQSHVTPQLLPTYRVMAILWFGKFYRQGLAVEVLGKDIRDHMTKKAHEMILHFGHETPVVVRTLTNRLFEWDEPE